MAQNTTRRALRKTRADEKHEGHVKLVTLDKAIRESAQLLKDLKAQKREARDNGAKVHCSSRPTPTPHSSTLVPPHVPYTIPVPAQPRQLEVAQSLAPPPNHPQLGSYSDALLFQPLAQSMAMPVLLPPTSSYTHSNPSLAYTGGILPNTADSFNSAGSGSSSGFMNDWPLSFYPDLRFP